MIYKLSDIMVIIGGGTPKTSNPDYWEGDIPWLSVKDFNNDLRYVYDTEKKITKLGLDNSNTKFLDRGDIIISARGTVGKTASIPYPMTFNQSCYGLRAKKKIISSDYLYYLIKYNVGKLQKNVHGSVFDTITRDTFSDIEVDIPELEIQNKIVSVLCDIDDKIQLNVTINRNLSEQALAIYHKMFVETDKAGRMTCKTDEFFNITIGKTPPRKEKEWFSKNPEDCVWISISDMGSCGTFIMDSSEYLTQDAVDKYNVKVVPDNTVILSFKLTVGRIAITVGETTTNEAIAHFNTNKDNITEYLYCYLKSFDFSSLGSTSSIGTAVNSKTIKAMEFTIPEEGELHKFCDIVRPMFERIKKNQFENQNLVTMRDSLLPKLMSGELDVSDIDLQ